MAKSKLETTTQGQGRECQRESYKEWKNATTEVPDNERDVLVVLKNRKIVISKYRNRFMCETSMNPAVFWMDFPKIPAIPADTTRSIYSSLPKEQGKRKFTKDDIRLMVTMYNEGEKKMDIARYFGCDHATVIYHLKRYGVWKKGAKK